MNIFNNRYKHLFCLLFFIGTCSIGIGQMVPCEANSRVYIDDQSIECGSGGDDFFNSSAEIISPPENETVTLCENDSSNIVDANNDGIADDCDDCVNLHTDDFESGLGIWNHDSADGTDAERFMSPFSPSGQYSMRIRDNSFDRSSIFTIPLDISDSDKVYKVDFDYQANGMEVGEDFLFEYSIDGGNTFIIAEDWISGSDFDNHIIYNESIVLDPQALTANTVLRFRCDASINSDEVYLDNISIEACEATCENDLTLESATYIEFQPGFYAPTTSKLLAQIKECDDTCPQAGEPCNDDGDDCTIGTINSATCNCEEVPAPDSDGDGVCDELDQCPDFDDTKIGQPCDDGDVCTLGETYDSTCNCSGGVSMDSDNDGVCDELDQCPDFDDTKIGQPCDDGDVCTVGETYDSTCNCSGGVSMDSDNDGVCDELDQCSSFDDSLFNTACEQDGDPCTIGTYSSVTCGCVEIPLTGSIQGYTNVVSSNNVKFFNPITTDDEPVREISGLTYNDETQDFIAITDAANWAITGDITGLWNQFDLTPNGSHCNNQVFTDTEAITYMSSFSNEQIHRYAIADERERAIVFVETTNAQNISRQASTTTFVTLEGFPCDRDSGVDGNGNNGIEGLAYKESTQTMYFATEYDDQKIYSFVVPSTFSGQIEEEDIETLVDLRDPIHGLNTFSTHSLDVMSNGNIVALITIDESPGDNGFFPRMIVEFDPCGNLLGQLDLEGQNVIPDTDELEGIAVVGDYIYVVGENHVIYQLGLSGSNLVDSPATEETASNSIKLNSPSSSISNLIGMTDVINSPVSVYPNPFSHQVKIEVDLLANGPMRIDVIDVSGRLVKKVVDRDEARKGNHVFDVDGVDLETGLYFVRVQAGVFTETKKITKL